MNKSKAIGKGDDSVKLFLQRALQGEETHGFDHDSLYYVRGHYYLFEYLKCESDRVTPHTSHPRYYPYNWKKFYSLWQSARCLQGYLLLVNYSERPGDSNQVKVMYVKGFDYAALEQYLAEQDAGRRYGGRCEYLLTDEYKLTFGQFSAYLRRLNSMAELPPEEEKVVPERVGACVMTSRRPRVVGGPLLPGSGI